MKTNVILILLCFSSISLYAQCNTFFPMRENAKVYYDHYDKKDKVTLQRVARVKINLILATRSLTYMR